jgi:DNA polymerase-3 subunit beta
MIRVSQAMLAAALSSADRVAPASSGVDIARCVILAAANGVLTIRATDFDLWITLEVACEGDLTECAVNASRLLDVASQMRSDVLSVEAADGKLSIRGERGASRNLPLLPTSAFPVPAALEKEVSAGLDATRFREGVDFVRPYVSLSPNPHVPSGIRIHSVRGAMRAVAASSAGMGFAEVGDCIAEFAVTLPLPFLDVLDRCLPKDGPFFLCATERSVEAAWKGGSLRSPVIAGSYPDYERLIPSEHSGKLLVNADELAGATKSARGLGEDSKAAGSAIVRLRMNGSVDVIAKSDKGDALEPVDAEWQGEPLTIGMASTQIINGMSKLKSASLTLEFGDAKRVVVVRPDKSSDRLALFMPVNI